MADAPRTAEPDGAAALPELDYPYTPVSGCAPNCGDCCKLIALRGTMESYRFVVDNVAAGQLPDDEFTNARHVVDHFIQIPVKLAAQMNARRVAQNIHNGFFICTWFDQTTNRCSHHEDRPPLCRGFPFYGRHPMRPEMQGGLGAFPRCSYWHDIPRSAWPAWADPLPAPTAPVQADLVTGPQSAPRCTRCDHLWILHSRDGGCGTDCPCNARAQ